MQHLVCAIFIFQTRSSTPGHNYILSSCLLSLFSVSSATEPDIAIILLITYYVNMFFLAKSCFHPVILIFYLLCHCFFDSTKQFVIGLIGRNMGILCFDLIRASE